MERLCHEYLTPKVRIFEVCILLYIYIYIYIHLRERQIKVFFIVIREAVIARLLDSFKYYNPRYVLNIKKCYKNRNRSKNNCIYYILFTSYISFSLKNP